jgi:uncharacterized alkaline shock family protein YloU
MSIILTAAPPHASVGAPHGSADDGAAGAIIVSNAVTAKLAAQAALEIPDAGGAATRVLGQIRPDALHLGGRQTSLTSRPKATVHVDGGVTSIDLTISVRWPASIPQVTEAVRRHVRERLQALTGLTIAEVRIAVTDLVTEIPPAQRVR